MGGESGRDVPDLNPVGAMWPTVEQVSLHEKGGGGGGGGEFDSFADRAGVPLDDVILAPSGSEELRDLSKCVEE